MQILKMEEQKLLKRKRKAVSEKNKTLLITACLNLAEYYFKEERYELAVQEYGIAAKKYKEMKDSIGYARSNRMIGEAYTHLRQYNKALRHQEIHLNVAVEENNKLEEQRALATIGHTYLTSYLDNTDRLDKNILNLAEKSFRKSLSVCENLTGISQHEHMDMTARLLANLGVVQECLSNYEEGIKLMKKSIAICQAHDIYEQLQRGYTSLASLYVKKGDYSNAIHQYNLAIDVAGKLENKIDLISTALVAKADIMIKLSDYHSAKDVLLKAYKLKSQNKIDTEHIEHTLKVVAVMCYTEDRLLTVNDRDYKVKKQLYEKMGDGASDLKFFSKAIEYYQNMLQAAIDNGDPEESRGPCYISLAQTYCDNEEYEKALEYFQKDYEINKNNIKERVTTMLSIAESLDLAGRNSNEIQNSFEQAILLSKEATDSRLTGRTISRYIGFLQKNNLHSKIEELQKELNKMGYSSSDSDSEGMDIQSTPNIGDDVNIDDITDVSDDDELKPRTTRKRNKTFVIKRNNKGETPLHTACIAGNFTLVQKLLEQGHIVNVRDNCGWFPIHEACICGHLDIVKLLIEKGAAINDRGGVLCGGMTPLHDATVNGHLDVIEYLLDKGASIIAKTDDGEMPIHTLKKWRNSVDLDSVTQTHYELIIERMMSALKRSGHDKDIVLKDDSSNTVLVTESNYSTGDKRKKATSYFVSSSDDDSGDENDIELDRQSSEHSSPTSQTGVTEEYRGIMKNLRYGVCDVEPSIKRSQSSIKRRPILNADEVGDDWLEDDMGRNKKRKTIDYPLTSTLYMRNSTRTFTSNKEIQLTSGSNLNTAHRNIKETKQNKKKIQTSLVNAGFTIERSPSPLSGMQTLHSHQQTSHKRKHHQVKLTSFSEDGNIAEADSTTDSPVTEKSYKRPKDSNVTAPNELDEIMLSVDVRITEKLYRVPIPFAARNTLTIKWLADEAAKRFCRKEFMKPILELETKNGAILAEDDCVSILFPLGVTQAEEVIATVIRWDVPPLKERYKEACITMNIEESHVILQVIQESSTTLDLSNRNLRTNILKPFCKAINRQTNLHHLNISGNFVSNECFELLCSSLPSLENLTTLNLSMNIINSEALSYLADIFKTQPNKSILENLMSLDLSYNSLGNESLKHLAIITRHLKLKNLKLVDVDFTSEIFDDFSNRNVELYLDYLEELDISENRLDKDDILKFIMWVRCPILQILNVSNNSVTESGLVVEIVRIFEMSNAAFWKLKSLNFARCKVTDSEVYELLRLLSRAEYFITLNLSYNENISAISLRRLLQHEATTKIVQLEGCQDILKHFENGEETLWNLNEKNSIKTLTLSLDGKKNKFECDILINMWKHKYHDRSQIMDDLNNFLQLSVS